MGRCHWPSPLVGLIIGLVAQDSRGEVQRLIDTFKIAAEEATRLYGELLPPDNALAFLPRKLVMGRAQCLY